MMFTVFPVVFFLTVLLGHVPGASAEKESFDLGSFVTDNRETWKIDADKMSYDQNLGMYEGEGNVRMTSGERFITADRAALDTKNQKVELWGNAFLRFGKNWLKGEHVVWNLDTETGWLDGGTIFFSESRFYVGGKYLAKTGDTQYEVKNGFLTSCTPDHPDWNLHYTNMQIDTDGNAWMKNTSFWTYGLPVAYSPLAALPVVTDRQSGFLLPWGGVSNMNGFETELPFYWAFRDDMDMTFYGRYMEERGWMSGLEYRVSNSTLGEGIWQLNYMNDQIDKSRLAKYGYSYEATDRYWLRGRQTFDLPWDIEGRLDVDFVSDKNFLQEFSRGSASYAYSNKAFTDFLERGILSDQNSLVRESALYLEHREESSVLSMDLRYWQQLDRTKDEFTVQVAPSFSYDIIPTWIGKSPFYYTLDTSLANNWKAEGTWGDRLDVFPKVYYPTHLKDYIDFESSVGARSTSYAAMRADGDTGSALDERLLPDVRLQATSRLNRVYDADFGNITALQHSIRPEIDYEYIPSGMQPSDFPKLTRLDQDQARNDLRYGFSTFLTAKEMSKDKEGNETAAYRELVRLSVFQEFNFEAPPADSLILPAHNDMLFSQDGGKGFSGVGMRFDIMPKKFITLSYDTEIYTDGNAAKHDVFTTIHSDQGHYFRVDYQYRDDLPVHEVIGSVFYKLFSNIYLVTSHDYSIEQGEFVSQDYGVRYMRGCWGMGLAYERNGTDNRIAFSFNMLGLGNFGKKFGYEPSDSLDSSSVAGGGPFQTP